MKQDELIFLGKSGRICGPFTVSRIGKMKESGELGNYSWIWDRGWKPLDPEPVEKPDLEAHRLSVPATAVRAVCFDGRDCAPGNVSQVSKTGCHFRVDSQSRLTLKKINSRFTLSLLEVASLRVSQVAVVFLGAEKDVDGWTCFLGWVAMPEVFHV
ncbi:hypothetical protein WDW86_02485 [Bdellovibrionota bacterium FG-2]